MVIIEPSLPMATMENTNICRGKKNFSSANDIQDILSVLEKHPIQAPEDASDRTPQKAYPARQTFIFVLFFSRRWAIFSLVCLDLHSESKPTMKLNLYSVRIHSRSEAL